MAAREEKKRNPNFSKEECALLAKLMGGESGHDMSRHALYKKGFSSSKTNSRAISSTGHGKNIAVLSEITDTVMNVIGKVGCGIEGIGVAESFDATCIHE
ncbi:hypothetical protein MAR_002735, partial [Mya arenaria]